MQFSCLYCTFEVDNQFILSMEYIICWAHILIGGDQTLWNSSLKELCHLEQNNILHDLQHGFRRNRSTETQLITFTHDKQTDVIIMDFAKAFDKFSHWRLILKLKNYRITGQLNHWIEDFLHQWSQRVVCNGEHSNWAPVLSGVPQGSVIGPILFHIYINDLPEKIQSTVMLFADGTITYMTMSGASDAASLQEDLDHLAAWENKWKMQFHPQTCSVLRLTRKNSPLIHQHQLHGHILQTETDSKYLGVTVNNKLNWNNHIDNVYSKANRSFVFLRRNFKISQTHIKANTYTTLVRPQLEYAVSVWDPWTKKKCHQLEMALRRSARYVFNINSYSLSTSPTEMIQRLG